MEGSLKASTAVVFCVVAGITAVALCVLYAMLSPSYKAQVAERQEAMQYCDCPRSESGQMIDHSCVETIRIHPAVKASFWVFPAVFVVLLAAGVVAFKEELLRRSC